MTETTPVKVSPAAATALAVYFRNWSGDKHGNLVVGQPVGSKVASFHHITKTVTLNLDHLLRNPNRVLKTVTPGRLWQEMYVTGAMLHEAAHARYTDVLTPDFLKSSGPFTEWDIALATAAEEARIEQALRRDAKNLNLDHLMWTLSMLVSREFGEFKPRATNPEQAVTEVMTHWLLRRGRYVQTHAGEPWAEDPFWVEQMDALLKNVLRTYIDSTPEHVSTVFSRSPETILNALMRMAGTSEATAPKSKARNVDTAKGIRLTLFPETADIGGAAMHLPCSGGEKSEDDQPEDEQSGEGESEDEQSEDEQPWEDEEDSLTKGIKDALANAIKSANAGAEADAAHEALDNEDKADKSPLSADLDPSEAPAGGGAGASSVEEEVRHLGVQEVPVNSGHRIVQRQANSMLRSLLDPSESTKRTLSESPSAQVDPAALASWRAAGQRTDPRFFVRSHREVVTAPPVEIAILVDVSGSMDAMQEPSSALAWSLASAAQDLANFAGRGTQVKTCMIHWGSISRVVQPVGALPGPIRTFRCVEGTSAMPRALIDLDAEMPGFFTPSDKPTNRLLVQFTDWRLTGAADAKTLPFGWMTKAIENETVRMITVGPRGTRDSMRSQIIRGTAHWDRGNARGEAILAASPVITYAAGQPLDTIWRAVEEAIK